MTLNHSFYKFAYLFFICNLLVACSQSQKNVAVIDKVQTNYNDAFTLNEQYINGQYGQPDPASFERLKRYRYEAYQALMEFRGQYNKRNPIPKVSEDNAKIKINQYVSYLNALGATSATKNTFTGF
ncbi:hypothetical protein [Commensalibacter papalotli (ex Servin-Garciduenas et al. 2014)]|uniref:Lipoprotein n=1 Tax=Commensalibacter papalotli (ex Servin-Garciduenas et al. 2014) TaxID=1208583 RepID=W7E0J5_9PROT|nr:hypothetical protein [Commensalibacter papalotli (ex Servin-Garciduenas et al. 2014)]EUK18504.1 hypothetical protein COMX_02110 [Commensalibacter papalotli (ex Servin-Garciduenas et al. 2014)]